LLLEVGSYLIEYFGFVTRICEVMFGGIEGEVVIVGRDIDRSGGVRIWFGEEAGEGGEPVDDKRFSVRPQDLLPTSAVEPKQLIRSQAKAVPPMIRKKPAANRNSRPPRYAVTSPTAPPGSS